MLTNYISIHVPTRGTTRLPRLVSFMPLMYFNPRAHEGHDECPGCKEMYVEEISIHVPTRGTTLLQLVSVDVSKFQSTCPRGARLVSGPAGSIGQFQSTCPQGARLPGLKMFAVNFISIHVPTRGTTSGCFLRRFCLTISIHVPTRGTTLQRL